MKNKMTWLLLAGALVFTAGCGSKQAEESKAESSTAGTAGETEKKTGSESEEESSETTEVFEEGEEVIEEITDEEAEALMGDVDEDDGSEPGDETEEVVIEETVEQDMVDLTGLSAALTYEEVRQMVLTPEDYVGEMISLKGTFTTWYNRDEDKNYFSCMVQEPATGDETGLEFVLAGNPVYPDDYPEEGSAITISGLFETYQSGDETFCRLAEAELQ